MKLIINSQEVLYDKEDQSIIDSRKWHINSMGYAVWRGFLDGKKTTLRLHRLINKTPKGLTTDHINHNRLDNRRKNLRSCTQSENMRNKTNQGKGYNYHGQNKNWNVETFGTRIGGIATEQEAKEIVELIRAGGVYIRPERTECKYGHNLKDAYDYGKGKICKQCQSKRSREYYERKTESKRIRQRRWKN